MNGVTGVSFRETEKTIYIIRNSIALNTMSRRT